MQNNPDWFPIETAPENNPERRDPLRDPKAGDVVLLQFRDGTPPWTRTVLAREGSIVAYRSSANGLELTEDLSRWQLIRHANHAEVLYAAD